MSKKRRPKQPKKKKETILAEIPEFVNYVDPEEAPRDGAKSAMKGDKELKETTIPVLDGPKVQKKKLELKPIRMNKKMEETVNGGDMM